MSPSDVGPVTLPPGYVAAARDVRYHSIASLTFLVWSSIVAFDDEVEYIWTMRNRNLFKWVYFILRYVVTFMHIAHNVLARKLADGSNPPTLCNLWQPYIIVSTQSSQTLLELILAYRTFALYNRSKKIGFILSLLILAELAGTVRMLCFRPPSSIYGACLLVGVSKNGMNQAMLLFVVHCTLIGLTLFKYFCALRAGWGRTPLVSLVVRESSTAYGTIFFLVLSVVILFGLKNERGVAIFYWITALMSILGCRMILSMERFARREMSTRSHPIRPSFTSEISLRTPNSSIRKSTSIPRHYSQTTI